MVDWDSMDVDKELTREVFKLTPRVLHVFLKTKILGRVLEILAPCFEAKTRPSFLTKKFDRVFGRLSIMF